MKTRHVVTPVEAPGVIELLLPTRGRPQQCLDLLHSLEAHTEEKHLLTVACFVDADDTPTREFFEGGVVKSLPFRIEVFVGPQTDTQGERYNLLREAIRPYPEFYMPMADDVVFSTRGWDTMVRNAFSSFEDRVLMCYPRDSTVPETQATYTILHADWTNVTGRFSTEVFPFWYEDSWVDEVAFLIGRKKLVPFEVVAPGGKGKTQGMRNLVFWERFYWNLLDARAKEATALMSLIQRKDPVVFQELMSAYGERLASLQARARTIDDNQLSDLEKSLTGVISGTPPGEKYLRVEQQAVWEITRRLREMVCSGTLECLQSHLMNLAHASQEVFHLGPT